MCVWKTRISLKKERPHAQIKPHQAATGRATMPTNNLKGLARFDAEVQRVEDLSDDDMNERNTSATKRHSTPPSEGAATRRNACFCASQRCTFVLTAIAVVIVGGSSLHGNEPSVEMPLAPSPQQPPNPPQLALHPPSPPARCHSLGADHYYTGFHPQSARNWLNDPNGPMYYNGLYHLFVQYNPNSYVWGDMHWYHLSSSDLLHWKHLPLALAPDAPYDCGGVFSGSATLVPDPESGEVIPVLTYSTPDFCPTQAIAHAYPANASDPDLVHWIKPSFDPIMNASMVQALNGLNAMNAHGLGSAFGFRDPTTAWRGKDGVWRMLVGCGNGVGACQFKSTNFVDWKFVGSLLRGSQSDPSQLGLMWECPDFFPLVGTELHVFKWSPITARQDWWLIGTYTEVSDSGRPDYFEPSHGSSFASTQRGEPLDFGDFYAAKSFYDEPNDRQVLFGWTDYHCPHTDWSGVLTFPRVVTPDPADNSRILTNPIPEISRLYKGVSSMRDVAIANGDLVTLARGLQLDVLIELANESSARDVSFDIVMFASTKDEDSGAALTLRVHGTARGFEVRDERGKHLSFHGEPLRSLRLLIDRSIVETFANNGRAAMTTWHCPETTSTSAGEVVVHDELRLVNHGGMDHQGAVVRLAMVDVHELKSANVRPPTTPLDANVNDVGSQHELSSCRW